MFDETLELQKQLESIIDNVNNVEDILEVGAKEFVKDLLKLTKPKSKIMKSNYTHLVDSFFYQKSKKYSKEVEVGWGKYYGPFVEKGTSRHSAKPHLQPLFNLNKNKYYGLMIEQIYK